MKTRFFNEGRKWNSFVLRNSAARLATRWRGRGYWHEQRTSRKCVVEILCAFLWVVLVFDPFLDDWCELKVELQTRLLFPFSIKFHLSKNSGRFQFVNYDGISYARELHEKRNEKRDRRSNGWRRQGETRNIWFYFHWRRWMLMLWETPGVTVKRELRATKNCERKKKKYKNAFSAALLTTMIITVVVVAVVAAEGIELKISSSVLC